MSDLWPHMTFNLRKPQRTFPSCWKLIQSTKDCWDVSQKSLLYTRYLDTHTIHCIQSTYETYCCTSPHVFFWNKDFCLFLCANFWRKTWSRLCTLTRGGALRTLGDVNDGVWSHLLVQAAAEKLIVWFLQEKSAITTRAWTINSAAWATLCRVHQALHTVYIVLHSST